MGAIVLVFLLGCGVGFGLGVFAAGMLSFAKTQYAEIGDSHDEP